MIIIADRQSPMLGYEEAEGAMIECDGGFGFGFGLSSYRQTKF
jgi:hypothetical protein